MGSRHEDVEWPKRRRLRLRHYDYSQAGAYAVTICTDGGAFLFGHVSDGAMQLNAAGRVVERVWDGLPEHYPHVGLDAFVVMPDHVHGVIVLADVRLPAEAEFETNRETQAGINVSTGRRGGGEGSRNKVGRTSVGITSGRRAGHRPAPTKRKASTRHGLSEVVRGFKSFSAKRVNALRGMTGIAVWQRGFYEHVVRNEEDLNRIREYIVGNPVRWSMKRERPDDGLREDGSR